MAAFAGWQIVGRQLGVEIDEHGVGQMTGRELVVGVSSVEVPTHIGEDRVGELSKFVY
jgi:hypothetical protein